MNSAGTTFGSITKNDLFALPVIIPTKSVISEFEQVCEPIFYKQMIIGEEINALTKQRDELLPLLMNGQASVNYHLSVFYAKHNQLYLCLKNSILCPIHLHLHPSITSPAPTPPQPSPPRHLKSSRRSTISHLSAPTTRRNVCHNVVL